MLILRTLLFVPGNQKRKIEKARSVPADAFILDLEDSVPVSEKDSARKMVSAAISRLASSGRSIFVRVNSLQTSFTVADIKATVTKSLTGICLPKSESADDIHEADNLIMDAERIAGLEVGSTGLLALIETPKGIINAYEIASASPRVLGVSFGAEDFALGMGISRTKEGNEMYYPRMVIAVACHAANVLAIDSVYSDIKDMEGLIAEAKLAKQIGFQGKSVLHPDQVSIVNEIFTPSEQEVIYARRVAEVFEAAVKQGQASTSLEGKMIDVAVVERARKLLAWAKALHPESYFHQE